MTLTLPPSPISSSVPSDRQKLHTVDAGAWMLVKGACEPSQDAIMHLADQLWERKSRTGRHLVVYGLEECFLAHGLKQSDIGIFLDRWAVAAFECHAKSHGVCATLSTADRPLGGLAGSLDYLKSFIPNGRRVSELRDLRRGLRYQAQLLQRDISAACAAAGLDKAKYLAETPPIVDETLGSIKLPHTDAGTTISVLQIKQEGVQGGRSQLTDLRALLAELCQSRSERAWTALDLLAPVRKQGVWNAHHYSTDVVLGLRPEYREMAEAFTLTIPDPARATTFFVNDLFDRVTGRFSGILHGAEAPRVHPGSATARRMVMNRAILAQMA